MRRWFDPGTRRVLVASTLVTIVVMDALTFHRNLLGELFGQARVDGVLLWLAGVVVGSAIGVTVAYWLLAEPVDDDDDDGEREDVEPPVRLVS